MQVLFSQPPLLTQPQIWEYFLAYSTIISRQGSATCYQITCVKNINSTHRVEGIRSQFGLNSALAASKVTMAKLKEQNGLSPEAKQANRSEKNKMGSR